MVPADVDTAKHQVRHPSDEHVKQTDTHLVPKASADGAPELRKADGKPEKVTGNTAEGATKPRDVATHAVKTPHGATGASKTRDNSEDAMKTQDEAMGATKRRDNVQSVTRTRYNAEGVIKTRGVAMGAMETRDDEEGAMSRHACLPKVSERKIQFEMVMHDKRNGSNVLVFQTRDKYIFYDRGSNVLVFQTRDKYIFYDRMSQTVEECTRLSPRGKAIYYNTKKWYDIQSRSQYKADIEAVRLLLQKELDSVMEK